MYTTGEKGVHKDYERERGKKLEMPCATIFNMLGFITTVSLTANSHCRLIAIA